jgi:hypothetical protein
MVPGYGTDYFSSPMMTVVRALSGLMIGFALMTGEADATRAPPGLGAAPAPSDPAPEVIKPRPRAGASQAQDTRCTADRASCITLDNYIPDVCRTIETAAEANALDAGFFARLLWKESLFDAAAVSRAGAQGIAQFMPETARLRGLADAFNPAEALHASARYLAELSRDYGNVGLAAAAYNGGKARVERFIAAEQGLPLETRAYVQAITGHSAEDWRDRPPEKLDLSLNGASDFQAACIAQAAKGGVREFASATPVLPWGVIIASNRRSDGAERQVARLRNRHPAVLRDEEVTLTRGGRPGAPGLLHFAQVGRSSRADAEALCTRLRSDGGDCMVFRN